MNQTGTRAASASERRGEAGTRPDDGHCQCEVPMIDPDDPETFCWQCRRFVRDPEEDGDGR